MNYDLIISDFDGTLLRRDDTISPRTVKAIKEFTAFGGIFGLSSGRAFSSLRLRLGELGLSGSFPVLCCQGAMSRDSESGELLYQIPMPKESAVEFLRKAENMGLMCQFYTADKVYAPSLNERNEYYFKHNRIVPEEVGKASEFAEKNDFRILKALAIIEPNEREKMLSEFAGIRGVKSFASHPMLIEAVSQSAGKGNGLKSVCKTLGINLARSVALGDELNDVEMIEAAGLGVAMGNAVNEAKHVADCVTADCDADGVAKVIEKVVSGEL